MNGCDQLLRDGFVLLRQALPASSVEALRDVFDANVRPSAQWPVPRGQDWRHAWLDLDPQVQAACRLPTVLSAVGRLIGERFFLAQVEGREPLAGGGYQRLHRDFSAHRPGDTVNALIYLDDYGPANGATRLVVGSHRITEGAPPFDLDDESQAVQLEGAAGDILVFDADLVHAASRNHSGTRRRTLLVGYFAESLHALHLQTADLRAVRLDTHPRFEPWSG